MIADSHSGVGGCLVLEKYQCFVTWADHPQRGEILCFCWWRDTLFCLTHVFVVREHWSLKFLESFSPMQV